MYAIWSGFRRDQHLTHPHPHPQHRSSLLSSMPATSDMTSMTLVLVCILLLLILCIVVIPTTMLEVLSLKPRYSM